MALRFSIILVSVVLSVAPSVFASPPHARSDAAFNLTTRPGAALDLRSCSRVDAPAWLSQRPADSPIGIMRGRTRNVRLLQAQLSAGCTAVTICVSARIAPETNSSGFNWRGLTVSICPDFSSSRTNLLNSPSGTNFFSTYSGLCKAYSDGTNTFLDRSISTNWTHVSLIYSPGQSPAWTGCFNGLDLTAQANGSRVTASTLSSGTMLLLDFPTIQMSIAPYLEIEALTIWPRVLTRDEIMRDYLRCKMLQVQP